MSPSPSDPQEPNPDSPSSPTPPSPPATLASRLFLRSSMSEPNPSSTNEPNPSPSPLPDADTAAPSWSSAAAPDPTDLPPASGGTLSIGKGGKVSKAGLRTAIGGGIRRVCRLVASVAADQDERAAGLWQADEDDVEDIGEPAAALVYRRLPEEARGSDAMDMLQLGLAVLGYLGKNLRMRAEIRARRAMQADLGEVVTPQ
jgi:hypothetical protein